MAMSVATQEIIVGCDWGGISEWFEEFMLFDVGGILREESTRVVVELGHGQWRTWIQERSFNMQQDLRSLLERKVVKLKSKPLTKHPCVQTAKWMDYIFEILRWNR